MSGSRASGRSSNSPENPGDSGSGRGTRGHSQASRSLDDTPFVPPLESGFANLRRELPQLASLTFFFPPHSVDL